MQREKAIHHPAYRRLVQDLVAARKRRHLSQTDVARSLRAGRQWVSKIENCEVRLDVLSLIRFCRIYRVSASDVIRRMEEELSDEDGSFLAMLECPVYLDSRLVRGLFDTTVPVFRIRNGTMRAKQY